MTQQVHELHHSDWAAVPEAEAELAPAEAESAQ
jgi:hypothetical protein